MTQEKTTFKASILHWPPASISRPAEQKEFERLDQMLSALEIEEADEFDSGYANSRAGRLEAALDRIEGYLQESRRTAKS